LEHFFLGETTYQGHNGRTYTPRTNTKNEVLESLQVFTPYALATTAYLTLQSVPLLLTPSLIISLLCAEPRKATDLELYFCRTLGLALLTYSATILPLTGVLPTTTFTTSDKEPTNPYAFPTLVTTVSYHAFSAFYLYTQLTYGWRFGFTAGLVASSGLFCLGLWVLMFGSEKGRVSKSTGADKRTGNFPFTNAESSKEKRREKKERDSSDKESKSSRRSMARTKSRD
jgi:hypothetical protein